MNRAVRATLAAVLATLTAAVQGQDDLARELPRIKPLEPAAALESFRVHRGFCLEPAAVEPLVTDPVSVCYDADGRLYVVEMRGYPYPEMTPSGHVTRLEDHDGDGRFDSKTIFLDGLSWPTGIVPYDGGVFIAIAPDILYAKDTTGDGVADVKKVMFTGFGTENVQGLLNGLLWGPDGWIYGVTSSNGGEIKNLSRPGSRPVSVRGRDFRFKPDGSAFEAISGGGQFGHSFDDWGHRFTCNNSNHIRQIVLPAHDLERNPALVPPGVVLDIAAEGPAAPVYRSSAPEPWRVVRTRQRAADPLMRKRLPPTELFAIGFFTSATGLTIYRGTAYPPEFRGNAFIGDVGGNLVHRKTLSLDGAHYLATRADQNVEFLASTDNWFRPVNFANTPDGTLLILDMYRETIEHPWSIPEPIKKHLDLTSGKDRGRLYQLLYNGPPRHRRPQLSLAPTADLVSLLADPDAWWRETAQRLLIERHEESSLALLREMVARRQSALGRLHALWTLQVLGSLNPAQLILGLEDAEPRVREQAVRLAEPSIARDQLLLDRVLPLANDPDPTVRFQIALALGDANRDPRVIEALARIAVRDAADIWTRTAVLSSISKYTPAFIEALAARQGFFQTQAGRGWLDELSILVGSAKDPRETQRVVERLIKSGTPDDVMINVLAALGRGLRRSGKPPRDAYRGMEAKRLRALFAQAAETAVATQEPADRRLASIALLGTDASPVRWKVLRELLEARQPVAVQLAALQALAGSNQPEVSGLVVGQWKSMSPLVRREAIELLFSRPERLEHLLSALETKQLAPGEIDPARLNQLRTHANRKLRERALRILGAESSVSRDRRATIDALRPSLALEGQAGRGRAVFLKVCATCHRAGGQGTEVGPDLATVAGRSPEDLLLHVLDPNREVAPNYVNYSVALDDGRVVSGIIASETAAALSLKRAEGVTDVVPRSQIEAVTSTGLSLMPDGLEKGLTAQDFADLIAFVKTIPATGR